ncbi:MAG: AhpC/TSA family protein [Mariniphaga sp.]|nr:AhpC/TSA family protein [Mariniphaga sp.]
MKKAFYLLIVLSILFACGKKSNFTISGQLDGGAGQTIYFNKILISNKLPDDSIKLDKDGKFSFKGITSSPAFYLLKLSKNSFVTLLVDSAENAYIQGSYKNFTRDYKVKGSIGSEILLDLDNRFSSAKAQVDSLRKLYSLHKDDPLFASKIEEWNAYYTVVKTDHSNYVTSFIKKNPFSLTSVYALYQKWDDNSFVVNDLQTMKTAASALFSVYPKNEQVIALYNNTLQYVKQEQNKRLTSVLQENAVNTTNIALPDADGRERTLWSLRGKYVLVHFWSAKDRASRIVNPVLSEIYNKFKNRGFEIFMVSVDNDRVAWMDAIANDNLSCINVGDMKGSFQAVTNYNIQELPFNYLLDKEGNIIARNLKGPALNQALSNIFK